MLKRVLSNTFTRRGISTITPKTKYLTEEEEEKFKRPESDFKEVFENEGFKYEEERLYDIADIKWIPKT